MVRKVLSFFIFLAGDFLFISLSFFLAFILRKDILPGFFPLSYPFPFSVFSTRYYFLLFLVFVFSYEGLYTKIYPQEEELRRIWRGLSIFFLALLGFAFITRIGGFSRFIIFAAFLLSLVLIPLERLFLRFCLYRVGLWGRRFLLVGDDEVQRKVRRELLRDKGGGVVLLEAEKKAPQNWEGVIIAKKGLKEEDLAPYLPSAGSSKEVFLFTDEPLFWGYEAEVERMGTLLFIRLKYNLLKPTNLLLKRLLELLLAFGIFLFSLPLFLIISLLIKLTSHGPVFFKQERVGEGGRRFMLRKFRTMVEGEVGSLSISEEGIFLRTSGAEMGKIRGDEKRITRLGKFLRRTSLDEVPQLLNLFAGDMSLIGPRPYLPEELEHAGRFARVITRVKPGITGLWQISGRADLSFEERFLLDEYYVKNWSLWLDIYIFLKTFWVIIRGKGAY